MPVGELRGGGGGGGGGGGYRCSVDMTSIIKTECVVKLSLSKTKQKLIINKIQEPKRWFQINQELFSAKSETPNDYNLTLYLYNRLDWVLPSQLRPSPDNPVGQ
jgi:hypothetical protein